jgi:hypothetical protein
LLGGEVKPLNLFGSFDLKIVLFKNSFFFYLKMDVLNHQNEVLRINQVEIRKAVWGVICPDRQKEISKIIKGRIKNFDNFPINWEYLVFQNLERSIDDIFK